MVTHSMQQLCVLVMQCSKQSSLRECCTDSIVCMLCCNPDGGDPSLGSPPPSFPDGHTLGCTELWAFVGSLATAVYYRCSSLKSNRNYLPLKIQVLVLVLYRQGTAVACTRIIVTPQQTTCTCSMKFSWHAMRVRIPVGVPFARGV